MKVPLTRRKWHHYLDRCNRNHQVCHLTSSLPFFQTPTGTYLHRARSATAYYRDGHFSHVSVTFWCGAVGSTCGRNGKKGGFLEVPSRHAVVCATCEGRAVGSGQLGAPIIAGVAVKFSPRN